MKSTPEAGRQCADTVLMIRLEKRLGMPISDRIAAKSSSVGELIDLLCTQAAAEA